MTEIAIAARSPVFDPRPFAHRIGLIALATDHTIEMDFARIVAPRDIGVYVNRIAFANPVTPQTLAAMQPDLAASAALILPDEDLDVVVYGCTSASVVIGDAAVRAAILRGKPGTQVVTPVSAVLAGLRAMGARKLSVLTPYSVETSTPMAQMFQAEGMELQRFTCMNLLDDRDMARVPVDEIVAFARDAVAPGSEALFISCTAVRAAGVIDRIEDACGVPVLSSNYAAAWNVLRLCGDRAAAAPGHLMTLDLPCP